MSTLWQIDFAGDRRTLKDWGLGAARVTFRSFAPDDFTAERADAAFDAAPLFGYDSQITLYRGAVTWFKGRVARAPAEADGVKERQVVRALGPWDELNRITYEQTRNHYADPNGSPTSKQTSAVILFQDINGASVNLAAQVVAAMQFGITAGAGVQLGTIEPAFIVPWEEATDVSPATVALRGFRWCPDAATRIDYATTPPTLHIRRRAALTATALALADCELARISSMPDLVADGVKIYFKRIRTRTNGSRVVSFEEQVAGATSGLKRLVFTVKLDDEAEAVPAGLAANFLSTISTLGYEGELTHRASECAGIIRPGHVLNLTGGAAAWTTMAALVQEVQEDIDTGATVVRFGPPDALGFRDWFALYQAGRNTRPNSGDTAARLNALPPSLGSTTTPHPFRVFVAVGLGVVEFGTVNNVVPTYLGNPLGATTSFTLASGVPTYVWLKVSVNTSGVITAIIMEKGTALPATPADASAGYCLIAIVQTDGSVLQSLNRSVWHNLFYRSHIFF